MGVYQMGVVEERFADIIWKSEPIASAELAKLAEQELGWKKSTTYTVLRRLCDKGIFQNVKTIVTSKISKEDLYSAQSETFVEERFGGSLPAFLNAFTMRKKLSAEEVAELRRMVDAYEEE